MALLGRSGLSWPAHGDLCGCATPRVVRRGTAAEVHEDGMYGHGHPSGSLRPGHGQQRQHEDQVARAAAGLAHVGRRRCVLQRTDECSSPARARCAMLSPSELCTRTWCGSAQLKRRSQQPPYRAGVAAFAHVDAKGRTPYPDIPPGQPARILHWNNSCLGSKLCVGASKSNRG